MFLQHTCFEYAFHQATAFAHLVVLVLVLQTIQQMLDPLRHRIRHFSTLKTLLGEIKTACLGEFAVPWLLLVLLPALFLVRIEYYYYRTLGHRGLIPLVKIWFFVWDSAPLDFVRWDKQAFPIWIFFKVTLHAPLHLFNFFERWCTMRVFGQLTGGSSGMR